MEKIAQVPITGDMSIPVTLINDCHTYNLKSGFIFNAYISKFKLGSGYQIYSALGNKVFHKSFNDLDGLLNIVEINQV